MPDFREGDEVVKLTDARCGQVKLPCEVCAVIKPGGPGLMAQKTIRDFMFDTGWTHDEIDQLFNVYEHLDKDWSSKTFYILKPVMSGFPSYDEAIILFPDMTEEVYEWLASQNHERLKLLFGERRYLAIDADLL